MWPSLTFHHAERTIALQIDCPMRTSEGSRDILASSPCMLLIRAQLANLRLHGSIARYTPAIQLYAVSGGSSDLAPRHLVVMFSPCSWGTPAPQARPPS